MGKPQTITLEAIDVSGQKMATADDVPVDSTVGELIAGLLGEMRLPQKDVAGRPLTYHALLEREGRHLHASEVVGESLQEDDHIVLQPNIDAGGRTHGAGRPRHVRSMAEGENPYVD